MSVLVGISTASSGEEAGKIARKLVESRLAACVNIIPGIRSVYEWEGEIREEGEALILIKTVSENQVKIVQKIKKEHSYEVPEIIFLEVKEGEERYLRWVEQLTRAES